MTSELQHVCEICLKSDPSILCRNCFGFRIQGGFGVDNVECEGKDLGCRVLSVRFVVKGSGLRD